MGLLKSVSNVPGIDYYDYRDSDYYNKFTYRLRFVMPTIRYIINESNVEGLMKRYNATSGWRAIKGSDRPMVTEDLEALKQLIELRKSSKKDGHATVRLEWNTVSIFSNDLSFLKNIENIKPNLECTYTQVQTSNFVGVKSFVKEPKHKFRVYLKSKLVKGDLVQHLDELLKRTPSLYPCTSLKYWLKGANLNGNKYTWRYRFTNPIHFIDYDDESTLSYLALMYGDYLGKRYKLEKRPEPI
jgi:hypothetical protein